MRIKKAERLDDNSIKAVIDKLDNGGTKKDACAFLNITYNTTRLKKIIEEYEERIVREATIRANLRSKPVSKAERKEIVTSFLQGSTISELVKTSFRSSTAVRKVLEKYNISAESNLVENGKEDYSRGDLVYSVKYAAPAEIIFEAKGSTFHGRCYNIYIFGKHQCRAYQPFYELVDLTQAQEELGIIVQGFTGQQARTLQIKDTA